VSGTLAAKSGIDYLEFGVGIDIQDLMLRRTANDLEIAVTVGENGPRSSNAWQHTRRVGSFGVREPPRRDPRSVVAVWLPARNRGASR
jgi:hypothetical protein